MSCGGAWWATVHGVTKSRTRLSEFTFTFHFHALEKEMATHASVPFFFFFAFDEILFSEKRQDSFQSVQHITKTRIFLKNQEISPLSVKVRLRCYIQPRL